MIHGNGGHIRAFALAWPICGKRSVCFAVDWVWETEREALRSIAKYPLKREPLPSEFIAILAAYIKNGDAA